MCNIAGYIGDRQAAPILVEMLRRQEWLDAGLGAGIATIHEGKIYHAKITGTAGARPDGDANLVRGIALWKDL